ncbi:hypothetical protein IE81DRAFT_202640 [Ceraceosorus guamensis]|uniref:Uncharacterized protein n=1 Tax=Ceraceosorus guamensis TaxID=1522189 RepID=A0A316VWJ7_9BASI|nr:hypothetical protein IE81DRAFT_202640 [Ceraceosorus guamensis]PWN40813.1 hypothetical protein IE81DRAFT_202640 [Ceraceosorus guamensis]
MLGTFSKPSRRERPSCQRVHHPKYCRFVSNREERSARTRGGEEETISASLSPDLRDKCDPNTPKECGAFSCLSNASQHVPIGCSECEHAPTWSEGPGRGISSRCVRVGKPSPPGRLSGYPVRPTSLPDVQGVHISRYAPKEVPECEARQICGQRAGGGFAHRRFGGTYTSSNNARSTI